MFTKLIQRKIHQMYNTIQREGRKYKVFWGGRGGQSFPERPQPPMLRYAPSHHQKNVTRNSAVAERPCDASCQTDGQTSCHCMVRAMHMRHVVKMTARLHGSVSDPVTRCETQSQSSSRTLGNPVRVAARTTTSYCSPDSSPTTTGTTISNLISKGTL